MALILALPVASALATLIDVLVLRRHYTLPHLGAEQALTTDIIARIHDEAQDLIESEVDQFGELTVDGIQISCAAAEGAPAQVLLEAAGEADLPVAARRGPVAALARRVGSRGRGGFKALLLGSVSQQCAHHTTCPVVIVPPEPGENGLIRTCHHLVL